MPKSSFETGGAATETVSLEQVGAEELIMPPPAHEALGELVSPVKAGPPSLRVGVGLEVLTELLEQKVDQVVGPKGKHNPERIAVRHGYETGEVTLGRRRVEVERPWVRSADGRSEAEQQRRRIISYRDLAKLAPAPELEPHRQPDPEGALLTLA